jgi:hypothetical protein
MIDTLLVHDMADPEIHPRRGAVGAIESRFLAASMAWPKFEGHWAQVESHSLVASRCKVQPARDQLPSACASILESRHLASDTPNATNPQPRRDGSGQWHRRMGSNNVSHSEYDLVTRSATVIRLRYFRCSKGFLVLALDQAPVCHSSSSQRRQPLTNPLHLWLQQVRSRSRLDIGLSVILPCAIRSTCLADLGGMRQHHGFPLSTTPETS